MFQTILVAVDGSPCARKAVLEAAGIASVCHAHVLLVYVVDDVRSLFDMAFIDHDHMVRSVSAYGQDVLDSASALLDARGVSHGAVMESEGTRAATVAQTLLDQARKSSADLIVMGTHGRRGMRRLVMGSVSREVVAGTEIPVLLVRSS
ncbi:universal stress protein [Cupriavidus pauculus]|uniref:universal stress protein n=1 Tax=Cupriavidus pauculus TaxID=82633 RepID=UPI0007852AE4|nr:universal stress protein [Cupriavidus pauculus]